MQSVVPLNHQESKMTYYTTQGDVVTADKIKAAVAAGTARILYSRMDYNTQNRSTGYSLSLDGKDIDTRRQCHTVWEEQWTVVPTLQQALQAAFGG
jgi:hypothetical protein